MHIFFDVDYTILGRDSTLRPGTHEIFTRLRADGHQRVRVVGRGRTLGRRAQRTAWKTWSTACTASPSTTTRSGSAEFGVPVVPDFVIDDYPGIVRAFGGVCITDYVGLNFGEGRNDRQLEVVYDIICTCAAGEVPDHPRYHPRAAVESDDDIDQLRGLLGGAAARNGLIASRKPSVFPECTLWPQFGDRHEPAVRQRGGEPLGRFGFEDVGLAPAHDEHGARDRADVVEREVGRRRRVCGGGRPC